MTNLIQSLRGRDIGHLRIIAQLWGIDLVEFEIKPALKELSKKILVPSNVSEVIDSLSPETRPVIQELLKSNGNLPWAAFIRKFGEIREIGPGQRDRDQTYLHPISPLEILFYRAILAKKLINSPEGAMEVAYIPDDLLPIITRFERERIKIVDLDQTRKLMPLGHPAKPDERGQRIGVSDRLLDDATTFLAAQRIGLVPPATPIPPQVIKEFLATVKIDISSKHTNGERMGESSIQAIRLFLKAKRRDALDQLYLAWRQSDTFDELRQIPEIVCEGEWTLQPKHPREFILASLNAIPPNTWWSLTGFIYAIKEKHPDFLRPAGDYDSWFIKRKADDTYLRGFAHWDDVDGAYIRYIITGPLFWLGKIELAVNADRDVIGAFRVVNKKPYSSNDETAKLHVSSQGKIYVPRTFPRAIRYLVARFCEWEDVKEDEYRYRVTPASLHRAKGEGLKTGQFLSLLVKNSSNVIPPSFTKAVKRWELNGTEARIESQTILRVAQPEVLVALQKSKAGRFLGEPLGPVSIVVKPGAQEKVLIALSELGLLGENCTDLPPERKGVSDK